MTLFVALVALTGWAQVNPTTALAGVWQGKLKVGAMSLTLVLHLDQTDGNVKASLDSPDQGAKGIPASLDYLSDDSVAVNVKSLGATYRARLANDKLNGTFRQNGMSFPLELSKGIVEVKRPQMPQPPFPYETEEVMFRNEVDGATLSGTLTWPMGYNKNTKQKPLVAIFVSGSGQQNRDEELFNHKEGLCTRCCCRH